MNFDTLTERAACPGAPGAVTPTGPDPFVAPSLTAVGEVSDPRTVMISAPAAVGKSTLAKWLASKTKAHFLDLGQIQVGSQGFIGDLAARGLHQSFAEGRLTVILDALDEGLVRSGFDNYSAFFSDLAKTVESVRSQWSPDSTRLILLGREEYIELTGLVLEDAGSQFDRLQLDYLDETRAIELVLAYAREATTAFHEEPSRRAVDAFFRAAARALEVDYNELWSSTIGRGFAGYPPVLRAVAQVISPNPSIALAEWEAPTEWRNAWQLLTETAERLLTREREKLENALGARGFPERAYDAEHQLILLARRLTGQPVDPCEGMSFENGDEEQAFREAVHSQLEVHPFLAEGASDVFGSMVAAAAVERGERLDGAEAKIGRYSKWPFMWRFFLERVDGTTPSVRGESLGWVLASLWTAIDEPGWTTLTQGDEPGGVRARINQSDSVVELRVTGGIVLRGIARDLEVELPQGVLSFGVRSGNSDAAVFVLDGVCSIRLRELLVDVPELLLENEASVSLHVERCDSPLQRVRCLPKAQLRVSKTIFRHPWSKVAQVLEPTTELQEQEALNTFLQDVARALPRGGRPAFLDGSGRPHEDDSNFLSWSSPYRHALGSLLRQLRDLGFVTMSRQQAHGPVPTFSYRPEGFTWDDLAAGLPCAPPWSLVDWSRVTRYL